MRIRGSVLGFILLLGLLFSQFHCTTSPMPGLLYNKTSQHAYGDSRSMSRIQSNSILKSGESCSFGSWFLIAFFYYGGGGSIEEAANNGGIRKIALIDKKSVSFAYGLFYQECTVVWGE